MDLSDNIYFNEKHHAYTNEVGSKYISVTTLIGKYETKFEENQNQIARACARAGKNPNHKNYLKYKGYTASQLLAKWDRDRQKGCDIGNKKHNYLENSVKDATSFKSIFGTKYISSNPDIPVQLYTVNNIKDNPDSGILNLDYFVKAGVLDNYPRIYNTIKHFVERGWRVYSEVAVYHNGYLISGLIDILLIKDKEFIILDWKTNKDPIVFEGGYWEHTRDGIRTGYKNTDDTLKYPLHKLGVSNGNKYALQLSLYAFLTECFGLTFVRNILCHITHDVYKLGDEEVTSNPDWVGKNKVELLYMPYLKNDIQNMIHDYNNNIAGKANTMFN